MTHKPTHGFVYANNEIESVLVVEYVNNDVRVQRLDGSVWLIPELALYYNESDIRNVPNANWISVEATRAPEPPIGNSTYA